ncbi:hypothetical protein [Paraburkholderia domus]|uniref:hypothetical protein n=1 Tax=Paraburkholderia domus TaxID=2793075 RepID=UPI001911C280|nr:hypothetical protein [Paraburkholderia domus]MBK5051376.1 hypothetical protein [Burkholderia sp. R-70006]MBK5061682.1 hypothetical protein [Burkholderia sp. R-70199]MBK5090782.1 hypothetical protein [Burkholderia sp. R-69927]MBK5123866.1 hypothetical protein [Burkholderia sp. R-69980]MBK5165492.1 hypothetical protein [Burkholderia sp. R-70211]MBK5185138.1 hypothetical protein [Burkholderia sp. R-69749]MCI0148434.1 hypothetical protein [Paraburkholderia sediminicola]
MSSVDHAQRECAGKDREIVAVDKEVRRQRAHVRMRVRDKKDAAATLSGSETRFKSMRYHCRIGLI